MEFSIETIKKIFYYLNDFQSIANFALASKMLMNASRELDVSVFKSKFSTPDSWLKFLTQFYSNLPKQGTAEWHQARGDAIGGSDIKGAQNGARAYVVNKASGAGSFPGNINTWWGHLFEHCANQIISLLFETIVEEFGSLPGMRNSRGKVIQRSSPDGVMITTFDKIEKICLSPWNLAGEKNRSRISKFPDFGNRRLLVVNEYKSPSTRIPNGSIYHDYSLQLPVALNAIPGSDMGIFGDFMFRGCLRQDFEFNNPDFIDVNGKQSALGAEYPLFMGMIGFARPRNVDQSQEVAIEDVEDAERQLIAQDIFETARRDIQLVGSDFYGTPIEPENAILLVAACLKFWKFALNKYAQTFTYQAETKKEIIFEAFSKFFSEQTIQFNEKFHTQYRVAENLCASIDGPRDDPYRVFGRCISSLKPEEIMDYIGEAIENRFTAKGCRLFYPDGMLINEDLADSIGITRPNTYGYYHDPSSTHPIAKEWLVRQIRKFDEFCQTNNLQPMGYFPWKLFKFAIMPVQPDPETIKELQPRMETVFDMVSELRRMMEEGKVEENQRKSFCEEHYDAVFKKYNNIGLAPKNRVSKPRVAPKRVVKV